MTITTVYTEILTDPYLAKLVVDSLNEEQIAIATNEPVASAKGIAKLERLLDERAIASEPISSVLRRVQAARTRSAAHRKGSDFDLATMLGDAPDLRALFAELLETLISTFDHLTRLIAGTEGDPPVANGRR